MIEEVLEPGIADVIRDFFDIEKLITHVWINGHRLQVNIDPSRGTHDERMRFVGVSIVGNVRPNEVLSKPAHKRMSLKYLDKIASIPFSGELDGACEAFFLLFDGFGEDAFCRLKRGINVRMTFAGAFGDIS